MPEDFKDQGGAASMNPPALFRWASSRYVRRLVDPEVRRRRHARGERARRRAGKPHRVEYFHQVEDGYSHLAAQLLAPLVERYDVELVCHLVTVPRDLNLPEPDLLLPLSRHDSGKVAPHYGLRFPESAGPPDPAQVELAERILAGGDGSRFTSLAVAAGEALWAGDRTGLNAMAEEHGLASPESASAAIATGVERRTRLGHYSGAMFYYEGEWYWGADRFYHLEERLAGLGADRTPGRPLVCPRPSIETGPLKDDGSLSLEIYPSLRSPYTSLIFDTALNLAEETGVRCVVRPVLPMVMRGVSATRTKGFYIFSDAAREAHALGLAWGRLYDPIGQPVRDCYSLYPWACSQGRGNALLSAFLRAAFVDGLNTNNSRGLRVVVENAGLSWDEAQKHLGDPTVEEELEVNRLAMYAFGSWGVPSFRLLDADGRNLLSLWGQDRLWLFAREIQHQLAERSPPRTP
ncbi:MAG: DsbA family protein [Myxococcota bacterium]|nr:DsbA family protein [Myxococcota bacterium]